MTKSYKVPRERVRALLAIRQQCPGNTCKDQSRRILVAMQQLGYVLTFEAMRFLDVFDPRPRKLELVAEGWPVMLAWHRVETEAGEVHRVGAYYLARDAAKEVSPC